MPNPGGWILVFYGKMRIVSQKLESRANSYILLEAIVYYKNNYHKYLKYIIRVDNMPITVKFKDENELIEGLEALKYLSFAENITPYIVNFKPGHNEKN